MHVGKHDADEHPILAGYGVRNRNGRLVDSLRRRLLRIPDPHPALTAAVQWAATRPIGDGQVVDKRRSERDAAPMVALELAVWGCSPMPSAACRRSTDEHPDWSQRHDPPAS